MASSGYRTKQKQIVLDYFQANRGVHITAAQAVAQLHAQGENIAPSTVYRCMERLENELSSLKLRAARLESQVFAQVAARLAGQGENMGKL